MDFCTDLGEVGSLFFLKLAFTCFTDFVGLCNPQNWASKTKLQVSCSAATCCFPLKIHWSTWFLCVPGDSIRDLLSPYLEVPWPLKGVTFSPSQKGHQQNCQVQGFKHQMPRWWDTKCYKSLMLLHSPICFYHKKAGGSLVCVEAAMVLRASQCGMSPYHEFAFRLLRWLWHLNESYKRTNDWLEKQACEDVSPIKKGDFPARHVRGVDQKVCEVAEKKNQAGDEFPGENTWWCFFFGGGVKIPPCFCLFCIAPQKTSD